LGFLQRFQAVFLPVIVLRGDIPLEDCNLPLEHCDVPLECYDVPLEDYNPPLEDYKLPLECCNLPLEDGNPPLEDCCLTLEDSNRFFLSFRHFFHDLHVCPSGYRLNRNRTNPFQQLNHL